MTEQITVEGMGASETSPARGFADFFITTPEGKLRMIGFVDMTINPDGSFRWNIVPNPSMSHEIVATDSGEAKDRITEQINFRNAKDEKGMFLSIPKGTPRPVTIDEEGRIKEIIAYNNGAAPIWLLTSRENKRVHIHISSNDQIGYEELTPQKYSKVLE
jgi:hypothetical protein